MSFILMQTEEYVCVCENFQRLHTLKKLRHPYHLSVIYLYFNSMITWWAKPYKPRLFLLANHNRGKQLLSLETQLIFFCFKTVLMQSSPVYAVPLTSMFTPVFTPSFNPNKTTNLLHHDKHFTLCVLYNVFFSAAK